MPRVTFIHVSTVTMALAIVAGPTPARGEVAATFGQPDAGYLADVRDLEITVTHVASENVTDVSLGLAPPVSTASPVPAAGASGVTLLFRARFRGQTIDLPESSSARITARDPMTACVGRRRWSVRTNCT